VRDTATITGEARAIREQLQVIRGAGCDIHTPSPVGHPLFPTLCQHACR
jgi:hypothetical protein